MQTIERPGALLRGSTSGDGPERPAILMLHAGGETRHVWTPVTEVLVEAGFRCTAFDQRGHGASSGEADELAALAADTAAMIEAEPPGCVVVGASLGGLAAMAALADPTVRKRVAGLVLVDVVPDPAPHAVRRYLAQRRMLTGQRVRLVDDILAQGHRLRQIVVELERPILLVRGGQRSPITDADAAQLITLAPHTQIRQIAIAGHLVARDQPTHLAQLIADWVAANPKTIE